MFKDSLGRWITVGLFEETAGNNKSFIIGSIEEARKEFLKYEDPTGYDFSVNYLGGFKHWKALLSSPVIAEHIEDWQEELEVLIQSKALKRIASAAEGGSYQANKFLNDRGWETRKAGRPSKAEVEKNINREKKLKSSVEHFLTPVEK